MEIKFLDNLTSLDNATHYNNPYKVTLQFGGTDPITGTTPPVIQGWIADDSLEFSTGNTWTELYSLVGMGSLETLNNLLVGLTGYSLRTKQMLTKIWTGTTTMEIKLGIIFQAESDSKTDVWDKIWRLFQYSSPGATASLDSGVFGGIAKNIEDFLQGGVDEFNSVPVMGQIANLASNTAKSVLGTKLLQSPDRQFPLKAVHIGTMLHLNDVQIRNISISPSLSNIGYSTSSNSMASGGFKFSNGITSGESFNNTNTSTFSNYARVDLQLMTNSIWTSDDVTNIIASGDALKSDEDAYNAFSTTQTDAKGKKYEVANADIDSSPNQ